MVNSDLISREELLNRIDGIWDCNDMVFEPDDHCCAPSDCKGCKWVQTKRYIRRIVENMPSAQQEVEKNEPLTLEELQKMPGQPVYIVPTRTTVYRYYKPGWALVNVYEQYCEDSKCIYLFEEMGTEWLAYRRPPVKAAPTFPNLVDEDGRELPGGDRS